VVLLAGLLLLGVPLDASAQGRKKASPGTVSTSPTAPERNAAIVNGEGVPYRLYEQLREEWIARRSQAGGVLTTGQYTDDTLFLQLIDTELLLQEARKRKISVSREAALELLLANPPQYLKEVFTDEKGNFRKKIFEQVVRKPELISAMVGPGAPVDSVILQWKSDIDRVVRDIQVSQTRRRLADALTAEKPLTAAAIHGRYFAEHTTIDGSFVRILHSTIPDSLVPVTEQEARAWYETHAEDYHVPESRMVTSLILPVLPSAADSAMVRARIDSVRRLALAAPTAARGEAVTRILASLPPNRIAANGIISPSLLPPDILPMLKDARQGDLLGPVYVEGEAVLFYVDGTAPAHDTVLRARHILLRPRPQEKITDSTNYVLALALKENIPNDSVFAEAAKFYSQDGSASKGGDLGYFRRGQMIGPFDSAAFSAKVGEVIGPVKTPYGYHLIRVTEQLTTGYALRELRFPIAPSEGERAAVESDARRFAQALRSDSPVDDLLATLRAKYPDLVRDTSVIKGIHPYGDALASNNFAMNGKIGDVGMVRIPNERLMVLKVLKSWPNGLLPFKDIERYPVAHARRARQLEMLKPRIAKLADTMDAEMPLGEIRLFAPMAEVFVVQNQHVSAPPDESPTILDSLIAVTPPHSVSGPVRGTHGYYFLRVITREGPTEADFARDRERFASDYRARYGNRLIDDLIGKVREYAVVKDLRPDTYTSSLRQ
jgi:hypothetical protein